MGDNRTDTNRKQTTLLSGRYHPGKWEKVSIYVSLGSWNCGFEPDQKTKTQNHNRGTVIRYPGGKAKLDVAFGKAGERADQLVSAWRVGNGMVTASGLGPSTSSATEAFELLIVILPSLKTGVSVVDFISLLQAGRPITPTNTLPWVLNRRFGVEGNGTGPSIISFLLCFFSAHLLMPSHTSFSRQVSYES